jgi:hypothetical protein
VTGSGRIAGTDRFATYGCNRCTVVVKYQFGTALQTVDRARPNRIGAAGDTPSIAIRSPCGGDIEAEARASGVTPPWRGSGQAEIPLRVALRTPPLGAMRRVEALTTMRCIKEAP